MALTTNDIQKDIERAVQLALEEDIGSGDITAELIPANQVSSASVITREDCIVCGQAWFDETFKQLGGIEKIEWLVNDGDFAQANTTLVKLQGSSRILLTGERTALNFLQLLSGTATAAREYAKLVADTNIKVLDTRKTIPGLRSAQKYAVTVGGCQNHRIGLYDAFLIKENHIAACGGISKAVTKARELYPDKKVEVEVENLEELKEAIECQVDVVMLDNFTKEQLQIASSMPHAGVEYEVSGNIDSNSIGGLLECRIDFVSSGALTKNVRAVDLSMKTISGL